MKKKKRNTIRRILPILLAALVVGTTLQAAVFAEEIPHAVPFPAETLPVEAEAVVSFEEESASAEGTAQAAPEDPRTLYADTGISPEQLYKLDFRSKRILVGTEHADVFVDPSVVVSSYKNTYLLQFPDEATARAAYAYYFPRVDFIEVDTGIGIARPEDGTPEQADVPVATETFMTEDANPFRELQTKLAEDRAEEENAAAMGEAVQEPVYDIALIDTGVPADSGIDAVSFIGDDPADDNGHGSGMLARIRQQNPEANVLSVKALDAAGRGDTSAVYAAMEYAIEKKVRIINLSMSAVASPDNGILEQAVALAKEKGILVVGAAGNNGKDARYYIPGSIEDALIIGACGADGVRLANSNFGETVDFHVVADSTSDATALFSGWLSVHGEEAIPSALGQGLIYPAEETGGAEEAVPYMAQEDFRAAYSISKTGVMKLGGYTYYIDPSNVGLGNPNMTFTNNLSASQGRFELTHTAKWQNWTDGSIHAMNTAVVYHSTGAWALGTHHVSGGFTLRWPDAAKSASGVGYDVVLEVRAVQFGTPEEAQGSYLVMMGDKDTTTFQTHPMEGMTPCPVGLKVNYKISIYKSGTNTPAPGTFYFGARDIDQPDYYHWILDNVAAHGDYWNHGGEWSSPDDYFQYNPGSGNRNREYTEDLEFYSAPTSAIYLQADTTVKDLNGNVFYATDYDDTPSDFSSGLVCAAPCSGLELGWSGSDCGTEVFIGTPSSYKIKAWVVGGVGGTITKEGYTYYYPADNSAYTMTPDAGWEIEYVKVDGTQLSPRSSYTFSNIQADHTICVKYRQLTGDLKISNTVNNGTLKVTKHTTGTGADKTRAFTFTAATLSAAGTYKKYNSDGTQVTSGAGSGSGTALSQGGTFTLANGQYILLSLPAGTQYTIRETADDDYRTSGSPVSGTIKANKAFTYTVNIKNGSGNVSGLAMPYTGSKEGTLTTNSSGNATITLSGGQNVTLTDIPSGYTYTVTQTADTDFTTTPSGRSFSGTKTTALQNTAFTNTPVQVSAAVENAYHGLGSHYKLTVRKTVTGNMGNRATAFHFRMTLSKQYVDLNDAVITYKKTLQNETVQNGRVTLTNGAYEFTLTHGDKIDFSGIPDKTSYSLTETDANTDQYTTSVSGTAAGSLTADTSVQYTNRRNMAVPTKAKVLTIGSIAFLFALMTACSGYIVRTLKKKGEGNE